MEIALPFRRRFLKKQVPGGANRDRTGDLLLAKQALSQLSYGPLGLPVLKVLLLCS
jgi:hypothetical protein